MSTNVVIVQDTDVTITGVYVNSALGSSQEAYCKMQYRVQSSVTEERMLVPGQEQPPKSYTPLSALSCMLPPGSADSLGKHQEQNFQNLPQLISKIPISLSRCRSSLHRSQHPTPTSSTPESRRPQQSPNAHDLHLHATSHATATSNPFDAPIPLLGLSASSASSVATALATSTSWPATNARHAASPSTAVTTATAATL